MQRNNERHSEYLDDLVYNLHKVGEDVTQVKWILKEGIWLKDQSHQYRTFCDLILVYYDHSASALELKGSKAKRTKAIEQINSGKQFIEQELWMEYRYGKFVTYGRRCYDYEILR